MRRACQWTVAVLLVAGCAGGPAGQAASPGAIGRMTAADARTFIAAHPEALVLDVRNPDEWDDQYGHIDGARQIPLPELSSRVAEVESWKDKPVVLVCRSGRRSQTAAELLHGAGYRQVFNLEGGMVAWRESERAKR